MAIRVRKAALTVIREGSTVLELLTSKNQTLLVWWNALLVLNLGFDIVDSVGRLDLKGDSLTSKTVVSANPVATGSGRWREVTTHVLTKICMMRGCSDVLSGVLDELVVRSK